MLWQRGKAYSQDLRARVLAAADDGLRVGQIATLLRVSVSYVSKVLSRRRRTGQTTALPQRGHLLPGPFLTDRLRGGFQEAARRTNKSVDEVVQERLAATPAGRAGDPAEFGDACAFLCTAKIGFMVGQNLLLDGGAYNSSMG